MSEPVILLVGVLIIILAVLYAYIRKKQSSESFELELHQNNYEVDELEKTYQRLLMEIERNKKDAINQIFYAKQNALKEIKLSHESQLKALKQKNIEKTEENAEISKLEAKHSKVIKLLDKGKSATEVAEELDRGVGEINIIASLLKKERNAKNG
ncbi:hypothetical protein PRVXT_001427 [Proteinivorax tanatarense]|uniref:Uncharacterized protein n=1 Tax=Proteinivorax tanatarense TaxID=1260629 RepID=A0AAU7VQ66_9FIRM